MCTARARWFTKGARSRGSCATSGRRGVTSVLIEGGAQVLGEAFDRRLVDRVQFYVAPLLLGGPTLAIGGRGASRKAPEIADPQYCRIGSDLVLSGDVSYPA